MISQVSPGDDRDLCWLVGQAVRCVQAFEMPGADKRPWTAFRQQ